MGRIILHIGTHKTATTTIQHSLYSNRSELARRGILYPDHSLIDKKPHASHVMISNALVHDNSIFKFEDAQNFFLKIREISKKYKATIISAECMYRHILNSRMGQILFTDSEKYWSNRFKYILMIKGLLGDQAEVAVVFRRQPEYAQSLYQENIKITQYQGSFQQSLSDFWYHFEYRDQAAAWARHFGALHTMRFEDLIRGNAVIEHFGALLGLDLSGIPSVSPKNAAVGVDATILKRHLNAAKAPTRDVVTPDLESLLKAAKDTLDRGWKRSFFDSLAHLQDFDARSHASNASLKDTFFPDLAAERLFSEPSKHDCIAYGDHLMPEFVTLLRTSIEAAHARNPKKEWSLLLPFLEDIKAPV